MKIVSAESVNEAHRKAKASAENAVEHAIECGKLLLKKKDELDHGKFEAWVGQWCDFSERTARLYMQAAKQKADSIAFDSLRSLFPAKERAKTAPVQEPQNGNALPFWNEKPAEFSSKLDAAPQQTAPSGSERAAQIIDPAPIPELADDWAPTIEEEAYLEAQEREYQASMEKVMAADDKLAAAHAEIKRQAAEIAVLKVSRDGFMNGKTQVVKMLKAEQNKVARLRKELEAARKEARDNGDETF